MDNREKNKDSNMIVAEVTEIRLEDDQIIICPNSPETAA